MKRTNSVRTSISNGRDDGHRDSIRAFYDVLKTNENDQEFIKRAISRTESSDIVKLILTKPRKNEFDIYILKEYLKMLPKLMTMINKSHDPNFFLTKISMDLRIESIKGSSFLLKIDEIVNCFYVLLKGEVLVLIPKIYKISMNRIQYINHLKVLYTLGENYLLEETIRENIYIFTIEKYEYEIKELDILHRIDLKQINIDEYLIFINGNKILEEDDIQRIYYKYNDINLKKYEVSIIGYSKFLTLIKGSTFGQGNLINENIKRQMVIFLKTNCIFGTLKDDSYQIFFQNFQKKIQNESYSFILNNPLFKDINIKVFIREYWNYFEEKTIKRDECLFEYNTERTKLFFLKEGEIKITANKLTYEKINKYISELKNEEYVKLAGETNGRSIDVVISYVKKGEIFGMGDMIYNNKLFCTGECISEYATFISIDMKYIENIIEKFENVIKNWKIIEEKKIIMMIERLNTLKLSFENSIEEQIKKNDKLNKNYQQKTVENFFSKKIEIQKNSHKVFKLISHKFDLNPQNGSFPNQKIKILFPKKKCSMGNYPLSSIPSYNNLLTPNISFPKIQKNNYSNNSKNYFLHNNTQNSDRNSLSKDKNQLSLNKLQSTLSPDKKIIKHYFNKKRRLNKHLLLNLNKKESGTNPINTSYCNPHFEQDIISKILLSQNEKEEKNKTRNNFISSSNEKQKYIQKESKLNNPIKKIKLYKKKKLKFNENNTLNVRHSSMKKIFSNNYLDNFRKKISQ